MEDTCVFYIIQQIVYILYEYIYIYILHILYTRHVPDIGMLL